jgi:hypothetical protein
MNRKSALAIGPLVAIALVATTLALPARGHDAETVAVTDQLSNGQASSAPIVMAQWRQCTPRGCF